MSATFTITVPWWGYGVFTAGVLGLVAAGYVCGRFDRRDADADTAIGVEFAPTLGRWQTLDRNPVGAVWPVVNHRATPMWAMVLHAWGQTRPAAGYPAPPALTGEPDPRTAEPTVGYAQVAGKPLDWFEEVSAVSAALGHVRWAADAEETGYIPAVRA